MTSPATARRENSNASRRWRPAQFLCPRASRFRRRRFGDAVEFQAGPKIDHLPAFPFPEQFTFLEKLRVIRLSTFELVALLRPRFERRKKSTVRSLAHRDVRDAVFPQLIERSLVGGEVAAGDFL